MKIKTIFLFLIFSLPIAGCDWAEEKIAQHKAEKVRKLQEKEKKIQREIVERHKKWTRKANINGIPVLMPSCIGMERDGDPHFLSKEWKNVDLKKRGKSTYETSARHIGFDLEFKRDLLRGCVKDDVLINDREYYAKDWGNPQSAWVIVTLDAGEKSPKITMNELEYQVLERSKLDYHSRTGWYSQTGELFGLEWWQVPDRIDPKKGKSYREDYMSGDDVFIQRDTNGDVITTIQCHNVDLSEKGKTFLRCLQRTQLKDLNAWLELYYLRVHLEHWQEIQQVAEKNIRSWIVETEPAVQ